MERKMVLQAGETNIRGDRQGKDVMSILCEVWG